MQHTVFMHPYLVHLEGGEDSLDQHSSLDATARDAYPVLREVEHVVPQASLKVMLELGEVEKRAVVLTSKHLGVVVEIEAKVEQRARYRLAIHEHMALQQMPTARPIDN